VLWEAMIIYDEDRSTRYVQLTPVQAILIVMVLVFTVAALTVGVVQQVPFISERGIEEAAPEEVESALDDEGYDEFIRALSLIMEDYVDGDDVDSEALLRGAIRGMIEGLDDPYSTYFDASALEDLRVQTLEGEYSGIGVSVIDLDGYVTVLVPFDDTPASTTPFEGADENDAIGLKSGDRILEVDGIDVVGMSTDHVAELIRGPVGESVEILVERPENEMGEQYRFVIEREQIEIPTADSEVIDGDIGVLSITQFTAHTPEQVAAHLEKLEESGIQGLILDLRSNPGGTLEESLQVADQFLPPGPVVTTVDREGNEETLAVSGPGYERPIVVLVDRFSASASEIIAGALRDRADAPLVGERTFGKGSVQRVYYLDPEQTTGMKLTTQRYLTPSGYNIEDEEGLVPDYEVEWSEGETMGELDSDSQLQRALEVLRDLIAQ